MKIIDSQAEKAAYLRLRCDNFGRGNAYWLKGDDSHAQGEVNRPLATFLGANGHAIDTYRFFTDQLGQSFDLHALEHPALWPDRPAPSRRDSFNSFAEDFAGFLDFVNPSAKPVTHIGHSLGATIGVMTALQRPQQFNRLVVIEPGTTPNWATHLMFKMLPYSLRRQVGFIKRTGRRRNGWPSADAFIDEMKTKPMYADFSAAAMADYAQGGLSTVDDEYRLRFSPQWESHIFTSVRYVWPLILRLQVPTLVLRGEHSNYYSSRVFNHYRRLAKLRKSPVTFQTISGGGHLLIQEKPNEVMQAISQWLQSVADKDNESKVWLTKTDAG